MNPRGIWVLVTAALFAAGLYAVYQGGFLAWHLFGFIVVLVGLGILTQFSPLHKIRIVRTLYPGPYYAGQSLQVTLSASCTVRWLWPYVMIQDGLPPELGMSEPKFIVHRLTSEKTTLSYQIPTLKRGVFHWDQVSLISGDPVGLFRQSLAREIPAQLVVWPAVISLSGSQLSGLLWPGSNLSRHSRRQHATNLRGVREYVPGDQLSHVHWKTSAHTGDFKVKQFEPETRPQFIVMIDMARHFERGDWEIALSVAASLLSYASESGEAIGLAALDAPTRSFSPATGPSALVAMLDFLSELTYDTMPVKEAVPLGADRSRLLLVTSTTQIQAWQGQSDWLIAIGQGGLQHLDDLPHYLDSGTAINRGRL